MKTKSVEMVDASEAHGALRRKLPAASDTEGSHRLLCGAQPRHHGVRLVHRRDKPSLLRCASAATILSGAWASAKPSARFGGSMVGPCDEGDATGRGQPVKT